MSTCTGPPSDVLRGVSVHEQRWGRGASSWSHPTDGRFVPARYDVAPLAELSAREFVRTHHYSASFPPPAVLRYGLWDLTSGTLVGVAVLSVPVQRRVLTNVFPDLEPYVESVELGRFVLRDEVPANAESWMLARVWRLAATSGVRGVVSFSDPVPRTSSSGVVVFPGHVGTIYQASNATYLGRATPRSLKLVDDPDTGRPVVLNDRALSKVRSGTQGHEYVERQLVAAGAAVRRDGEPGAAWLAQALVDAGVRRVRHGGCHRYAFRLGSPAERRRVTVGGRSGPYPKRTDRPSW